MRRTTLFTTMFLTALTTASVYAAGQPGAHSAPPQLFTIEKTARAATGRWLLPDATEEFLIQTDPAAVAANPPAFTIDLPDLPLLEAVRKRFVVYGPEWKSWIGTLRYAGAGGKGAGYIHLGYHGNQLTALIEFEGHHFRIVGEKGSQRLARISEDLSPPSCGLDEKAAGSPPLTDESEDSAAAPAPVAWATDKITATNRIDLLAVYPRAFFSLGPSAETALGNFIRDSISLANDAFVNSQIDAAYNLVGIVPITGTDQPATNTSITGALTWLTGQPTEVVNLRNAFGADVVTIYIPWSWSSLDRCGIANMYRSSTSYFNGSGTVINEPLGDRAYSANRDGCGLSDYTLGHEIGHNYGMWHDAPASQASTQFPNGLGNVFTVNGRSQATVMGCSCTGCFCSGVCSLGSGAVCNRIPYFSDPNISYLGVPTGAADRNNAAVGRAQVPSFAAIRSQSANTPPTANFTVSCSGRTCSFNATSSTDNTGIVSYWWDFGDGSAPGSGATPSHPYPATGISFPVHLVVTDNGGQTAVKASTVEPQPAPLYEGFHEVANCSTISGWAWDQNQPNSPINVSIDRDNIFIANIAANLFRQDLVNAGKGNGSHAFVYNVDTSWKDGVSHSVRVRYNTTTTSLTWSPRTILCGVTCFTNQAPQDNLSTGGTTYVVATQFSSSVNGTITHLGFYRAAGESSGNVARLWTDDGVLLGQVDPLPNSPSSGWVWGTLSSPVTITAGTRYRVAVNTNFQQAKTGCGIGSGITNQYLTAHQGFWSVGTFVFPTTSSCSNFFVDVRFDPS